MKSLIQIAVALMGLGCLVALGLRGFVILSSDPAKQAARAHGFLLAASAELDLWYDDAGAFPDDLNVLQCTGEQRDQMGVTEAYGGVLRAPLSRWPAAVREIRAGQLLDPWGMPWQYEVGEGGSAARLRSLGADREEGGEGPGIDLVLSKLGRRTALSHLDQDELW